MTLREHFTDIPTGDNTLQQAVEAVFSPSGHQQKSVLNADQIVKIAVALSFADKYNVPMLKDLCNRLMELKVSERGRGRTDMIAAINQQVVRDILDSRAEKRESKRYIT